MRWLPPESSPGLDKRNEGEIVEFFEKAEQGGKWPQQACTTRFFLIPKSVTSERPLALMPTLICWWEALWASEVARWQQRYRIEWDATEDRNGGAQRTVWKDSHGDGEVQPQSRRRRSGKSGLGSGPDEGL